VSEKKGVPVPINEGLIKKGGVNDAPVSPRPTTPPPAVSPNTGKKSE